VKGQLVYQVCRGQKIDVILWHKWGCKKWDGPFAYDFIFGTPAADNPYRKAEAGFFQYRDRRKKKVVCGFYVDMKELEVLARGFNRVLRIAKRRRKTRKGKV
jgi:hypothetical protein